MTDLFDGRRAAPMLIGASGEPFDSGDYLHELKLDGARCLAYLDRSGTDLVNKRDLRVGPIYPELTGIHRQVKDRCILDGELVVMKEGKPDFSGLQRRALMSDPFKIRLVMEKLPVSFAVFDILYLGGRALTSLPLAERKEILARTVSESERLAVSRWIEKEGAALFRIASEQGLEGIVSKRKDSLYYCGKRTDDWIKIKNLQDDDFVICGYIRKEKGFISLVLGQYEDGGMVYRGHVTLGVANRDFQRITSVPESGGPPFGETPSGNERAVWLEPVLAATVKYMDKTASGILRQPVFKGLRDDKAPEECRTA